MLNSETTPHFTPQRELFVSLEHLVYGPSQPVKGLGKVHLRVLKQDVQRPDPG